MKRLGILLCIILIVLVLVFLKLSLDILDERDSLIEELKLLKNSYIELNKTLQDSIKREKNYSDQIFLLNEEKMDLNTKINSLERELTSLENSKPLFQQIAEDIANAYDYSYPEFACENFTDKLVRVLRGVGYDASRVKGYALNCDPNETPYQCRHVWTKIDNLMIESTTGKVLEPQEFKENYLISGWG